MYMMIYLPSTDFSLSAECLDFNTLKRQFKDAVIIMKLIMNRPFKDGRFINMRPTEVISTYFDCPNANEDTAFFWRGKESQLYNYVCTMRERLVNKFGLDGLEKIDYVEWCSWMQEFERTASMGCSVNFSNHLDQGDRDMEKVVRSHRSALLRKKFLFYYQYDWNISSSMDIYWPTRSNKLFK